MASPIAQADLDRLASDLAAFARTGIPMPEGLRALRDSLPPGRLRDLSAHIAARTEAGDSLADAVASAPPVIAPPPEFAALLRCGDAGGDLRGLLDFTVEHGRRVARHRAAVGTAFVYPATVAAMLLATTHFLMAVVIPKFRDIYDQLGAELPLPTQVLMAYAELVSSPIGTALLLAVIGAVVALALSPVFRERFLRSIDGLPGLKQITALSDTALWTKFVGRMTARAVPLPQALRAAGLAVARADTRRSLAAMADAAEQGRPTAGLLAGGTPALSAWLYAQGESRGDLPAACEGIAEACESRFEILSRRALAVLEPTLLVVMAVLVGMAVISLYLPLFNIPKIVGRE